MMKICYRVCVIDKCRAGRGEEGKINHKEDSKQTQRNEIDTSITVLWCLVSRQV
jgi:hypothetical protein